MKLKHIFGPVLSRRLGKSLGIDLVPYKTCSLDCVYCECGATNNFTRERKEYVPTNEVIRELDKYLSSNPDLDYLTFSGSGEPTLHQDIGKIISFLKEKYPAYQVALLTNSTLLDDDELIEEIKRADLIVPSLDAVSEEVFNKINRPVKGITAVSILHGLEKLARVFIGQIWLEIFIIPGINDNEEELQKFKEVINRVKPNKIQLNHLDRLGTEKWVKSAPQKSMHMIAEYLGDDIEIIG